MNSKQITLMLKMKMTDYDTRPGNSTSHWKDYDRYTEEYRLTQGQSDFASLYKLLDLLSMAGKATHI